MPTGTPAGPASRRQGRSPRQRIGAGELEPRQVRHVEVTLIAEPQAVRILHLAVDRGPPSGGHAAVEAATRARAVKPRRSRCTRPVSDESCRWSRPPALLHVEVEDRDRLPGDVRVRDVDDGGVAVRHEDVVAREQTLVVATSWSAETSTAGNSSCWTPEGLPPVGARISGSGGRLLTPLTSNGVTTGPISSAAPRRRRSGRTTCGVGLQHVRNADLGESHRRERAHGVAGVELTVVREARRRRRYPAAARSRSSWAGSRSANVRAGTNWPAGDDRRVHRRRRTERMPGSRSPVEAKRVLHVDAEVVADAFLGAAARLWTNRHRHLVVAFLEKSMRRASPPRWSSPRRAGSPPSGRLRSGDVGRRPRNVCGPASGSRGPDHRDHRSVVRRVERPMLVVAWRPGSVGPARRRPPTSRPRRAGCR